ncbi:MAG: CPBP family intramembrane metalloprotease [Planctomycetes bacterium]|nr:CPBP family intramembrane metalloprotease [Planctomycetota bacterium]
MNEPQPTTQVWALGRVLRLARKELREILRDRRTIITLVAMPVLLYPLMSVLFLQFALASKTATKETPKYQIGILTSVEAAIFNDRLDLGRKTLLQRRPPAEKDKPDAWPDIDLQGPTGQQPTTPAQHAEALEHMKALLYNGDLDLIVVIPNVDYTAHPRKPTPIDRALPCQLIFVSNSTTGREAIALVERLLAAANEENLKARFNVPVAGPHITVLSTERVILSATSGDNLLSLSALVPLVLILMTITGAVYPAIDLTAGERERGTLEILVAAPVPRFELLTAKYLSVVTVAVLNAIVNLVCMTITVRWSGVSALLPSIQELSFTLVMQVFALLLLFAAFYSAVLLCLTSFARSFKEAQAYLIPLMLVSLAPGIMAMMPGLVLDHTLASLPLVNIVLMARDLFEGGVAPLTGTIVIVTTLLYALAALSLAARVFGAESVLYSEQSSWADMLRRPDEPQPAASLPAMLWCLALMMPIQFALVALMRSFGMPGPVTGVLLELGLYLVLFAMLPAVFVYLGRVELGSGLGLTAPRPFAVLGALLLGASLWTIELRLLEWIVDMNQYRERFAAVLERVRETRTAIGWGVLAVGIVPAVVEELFFRGLLFNALKARCGAIVTIGVSGVLFGVTHVILGSELGLVRLVPSTLLGLVLSTVCWHTGSLWPGMILHICHNSVLLGVNPEAVPWEWLAAGLGGATVGAALVWLGARPQN